MCDTDGNNPLHIACKEGHLAVVRVLLIESSLDADMINLKGHNPLHVLAKYGKENAAAICNLLIETIPDFPIDRPDLDGNTGKGHQLAKSSLRVFTSLKHRNNISIYYSFIIGLYER